MTTVGPEPLLSLGDDVPAVSMRVGDRSALKATTVLDAARLP